jgi:CheY-like chemotaxis protein
MTVLIVDDYVDTLVVWDLFLTALGYEVITAADGREGLEKARSMLPDIGVLDLQMPGVSGREMAAALRADPRTTHIPLIAATGNAGMHLAEAHACGFDAFVVKPCDPDVLVSEIRRLTRTASSDRAG